MVQRMAGPEGLSAFKLAEEIGVHQSTLSRWLRETSREENRERRGEKVKSTQVKERRSVRPDDLPPVEEFRRVMEASALSQDELGAFLRRTASTRHSSKSGARRSRRPPLELSAIRRRADAESLPRQSASSSSSEN